MLHTIQKTNDAARVRGRACVQAIAVLTALGLVLPAAAPAFADPPPWAKAYGYREKHDDDDDRRDDKRGKKHHEKTQKVSYPRYLTVPQTGIGTCNRDILGAILGGVAGGAAGTQIGKGRGNTAAIIAGTILGGLIGGSVGRSMDSVDTQCVGQVMEHLPNGQAVEWQNPDGKRAYRVTPVRTYQTDQGRYCREYTATANVGGRQEQTYGQACREPDGTWRIVS